MWQTIDIPDSVFNIGIHLKEGNWDSIENNYYVFNCELRQYIE